MTIQRYGKDARTLRGYFSLVVLAGQQRCPPEASTGYCGETPTPSLARINSRDNFYSIGEGGGEGGRVFAVTVREVEDVEKRKDAE